MKKFNRFLSVLLALVFVVSMFPQIPLFVRADETTDVETGDVGEELLPGDDIVLTRGQWLQKLVDVFSLTMDDDVVLDEYYTDVTSESEYYDAVMLAVYHGLIDQLPGTEFQPDSDATREFAAQTLNFYMGYVNVEEDYTYSDTDAVTYHDDVQVAISRGWFALVDGAFMPNRTITSSEVEVMLADAAAFVEKFELDSEHENSYVFKEGVVEITKAVEFDFQDDFTVISVDDLTQELSAGDKFVVYYGGLAIPYMAEAVGQDGTVTVITASDLDFYDAIESMDVQSSTEADPMNYYTSENTELVFIEEDTGYVYESAAAASAAARGSFKVVIPKFTTKIAIAEGVEFSVSVELKNAKVCTDTSWGLIESTCNIWFQSDVEATAKVSCDLLTLLGDDPEIYIGGYSIPGVGGLDFYIKLSMTGSISMVSKYHMRIGIIVGYNLMKGKIWEPYYGATDKASSFNAEISAKIYLEVKFGIFGKALPVEGYLYGEVGFQAKLKYTTYEEIEGHCSHFAGWFFMEYGFKLSWEFFGIGSELDWNKEVYNEKNSPVKIVAHYEDGVKCEECTRDDLTGTTSGSHSALFGTRYNTRYGSSYYGSGLVSGGSSTARVNNEPITVYSYTLDDDDNATITDYYGNVTSLTIPYTLDGYQVVAIGKEAFKDRTELKTVIIQDNITSIGSSAFQGCSNLRTLTMSDNLLSIGGSAFRNCVSLTTVSLPDTITEIGSFTFAGCSNLHSVKLPASVTTIGAFAFMNCDRLKSIHIPASLDSTYDAHYNYAYRYGVFYDCDNLTTVTFGEGTTQIPNGLFANCPGLRHIDIPATVTVIEGSAFAGCVNLESVSMPTGLLTVCNNAFEGCTSLTAVDIPDTVTEIQKFAFANCTSLARVHMSTSLVTIGGLAFMECDALTSIHIPVSLDYTTDTHYDYSYKYGPFAYCDNLSTVTFEEGVTQIANGLFARCYGLESIVIPDTVTVIEDQAFYLCKQLKKVTFSSNLTTIGNSAFQLCDDLTTVEIPDSVTRIEKFAFAECPELDTVKLSNNLETMGAFAFFECDLIESIHIPKSLTSTYDAYYDYAYRYGPFYGCDGLKTVTFQEGMATIPNGLFANCPGLETIVIPDTVTIVEAQGFYNCTNLQNVTLSNKMTTIGNSAFEGCEELPAIVTPDSVTYISKFAFADCIALTDVKLSSNLEGMGAFAFKDCDALESIFIPKSLTYTDDAYYNLAYRYGVFAYCDGLKNVSFEEGMASVPNGLFTSCYGLETIVIPETVTVIGDQAFNDCTGLVSVTLPDGLVEIKYKAFANCTALPEILIPDSVSGMGTYVFENCTSLVKAKLPDIRVNLMEGTFKNCTSLTDIVLPDSLEAIRVSAFEGCTALPQIVIPGKVTVIEKNAFYNCDSLTEIIIPGNVLTVGENAFRDCDALTAADIQFGVKTIGNNAFYDCDALQTVTMANTVTSMGSYCFYHCDVLKDVKLSLRLSSISKGAFRECPALEEIVIPYFTTSVADEAFNSSTGLKKVVTHENLTSISSSAFSYPDLTVFYGTDGSYAQSWAGENDFQFVVNTVGSTGCELVETTLEIAKGASYTLNLNVEPIDFCDTIYFKSSNTDVVTVDDNGTVKAVGVGTATVKMVIGNYSASCKITVTQGVTRVTLNKSSVTIYVPDTYQLTATVKPEDASNPTVIWTSSDESVATVDENGLVTAVGNGTATITATSADGTEKSASCTVTVIDPDNIPVSSITISGGNVTLEASSTYAISVTVKPNDAANAAIIWTSSDESVATVDENGVVTAVGKGTATITATAADGYGATASFTVNVSNDAYYCDTVEELESSHNYPTSCTDIWVYTVSGAQMLYVTFDEQTVMEDGFDYLYIYDGEGNLVGKYTGEELSGQTVTVEDETVKIQIKSDESGTDWGFKVSSVEAVTCVHSYESVVTAPTCTEGGYTTHTCTQCGASYTDTQTEPIGHTSGEPVQENYSAPTCTTDGGYDKTVYCSVCGEAVSSTHVTVDAAGHTPGEAVHTNETDPTCTADGGYDETVCCSVCGETISSTHVTVEATGHAGGTAVRENYVAPSAGQEGSYDEVVYCKHCGEELSRTHCTVEGTPGDVNADGWIDAEDAALIMQYEVGLIGDDGLDAGVADVNSDGWIDAEDAALIMQLEVGLIEGL